MPGCECAGEQAYNDSRGAPPLAKPSVSALLGLSIFATACAEAVAYPLYLVKTLQQSTIAAGPSHLGSAAATAGAAVARAQPSALDIARRVWAERGPLGFYAGVSIAGLKSAPAAMITYYVYESMVCS